MILTITLIELKGPFKYFTRSLMAFKITKQLKTANYLAFKSRGLWTKHYTMALWQSQGEMKNFATSGAHLKAMHQSKGLAKEIRTLTFDADELPSWSRAKQLVTEGKMIYYN